jgi:hypothetical protein
MFAFLHRGMSLAIFGAIYHRGLVSLSVRRPSASKKQKTPGQPNVFSSKQGGTKSQHYFNFIPSILDEFDKHMQERNLVMDIASIHHSKKK